MTPNFQVLAHIFGLIGDGLNLIGAAILVGEMTQRSKEHKVNLATERLAKKSREQNTNIVLEEIDLRSEGAVGALTEMVDRRIERLGHRGYRFILAGFFFLVLYRITELAESILAR